MADAPLIACHECDLLQRETPLPPGGTARCRRCGAVLYRHMPHGLDRTLAFTLSGAVLFVIANGFPILGLDLQGNRSSATLSGAVRALYNQDMSLLAVLVFITTILVPALQLAAMCYMLLPLRFGRVPPGFASLFRFVQAARPWGMVEVFMLGVLVALVKLGRLATVTPGIALWSLTALIFLLAAGAATFDAHDAWKRAAASTRSRRPFVAQGRAAAGEAPR